MKLRLQSSWKIKKTEDGVIEFFSEIRKKKYGIKSKNSALYSFLDNFKLGIEYPKDILLEAKRNGISETSINSLIENLVKKEILIEDYEDMSYLLPKDTLYDRQIRFFRSFERKEFSGENLNENLQKSTVLIAGLGGYGSWIALLCARMGIRNIIGLDFDHVDITNLNRQIVYDRQDIGILKIKACEKKIKEADPDINFTGINLKITRAEDLTDLLEGVDLVFNPFSYVPSKKAIHHPAGIVSRAALFAKKPCLTFGGSWIGPLTILGKTPCYFCTVRTLEIKTDLDPEHRNAYIQKRAFAPPIATCCSMAAFEAARFLSKSDSPQVMEGLIQLDIFNFSYSNFLSLKRQTDCPFCSPFSDKFGGTYE